MSAPSKSQPMPTMPPSTQLYAYTPPRPARIIQVSMRPSFQSLTLALSHCGIRRLPERRGLTADGWNACRLASHGQTRTARASRMNTARAKLRVAQTDTRHDRPRTRTRPPHLRQAKRGRRRLLERGAEDGEAGRSRARQTPEPERSRGVARARGRGRGLAGPG